MPNRLADATSPYLLQHAGNPVDWSPWDDHALARAREQDKPLFVSIGYAACHWCHVMERESFEDPATAALLNDWFVPIKIDREERPDLDAIYMSAVQAMTGHGGWPMSVFCTPDGKPFWGGTYFPDEPRHGMPAFRQVLQAIHDAWTSKRGDIEAQGDQLTEHIARVAHPVEGSAALGPDALASAARAMLEHLDSEWGGFGGAPKFPQPMNLEFLLRADRRGVAGARDAVTLTLDRMARGGIFDQVGGGFHRYAVDRIWLVPHFEKMLYDNAQLLRLYARAFALTGEVRFAETARATGRYLLREMQHPDGGFFCAQDADSDGGEGRFYTWPYDEIIALAGDDMPLTIAAFALSGSGNWEGVNVLWRPDDDEKVAADTGASVDEVRATVDRMRARLFDTRERRVRPSTDDKILTAWNGLAIAALADASILLEEPGFLDAALRAARCIETNLRRADGRILRSWRDGRASGPGFLDDHAMLADGYLALYEATFDPAWWERARTLADDIVRLFADAERGGFYDTGADAPPTVVRPKDLIDNAVPSGNAVAADVLRRVAALSGDGAMADAAEATVALIGAMAARAPLGFGHALSVADSLLGPPREIAIVGDLTDQATLDLLEVARSSRGPGDVIAAGPPGSSEPALLRGRDLVDGVPTAYVCRGFVCDRPVTSPGSLDALIGQDGQNGRSYLRESDQPAP